MRRSSILTEFSKIAQTPPPVSNAIPIKGQVTAADIDRCRAQLKKRIDDDGTKDRCAVIVRTAELGEMATIKGIARDMGKDTKYIKKWVIRFNAFGYNAVLVKHFGNKLVKNFAIALKWCTI